MSTRTRKYEAMSLPQFATKSLPQMFNKCKYKKWGVIFGYISEYKYGLVCDYIFHKAFQALWHLIMWRTRIFYLDIHPKMISYFLRMWHYGALSLALPFTFRCLKWTYPWIHGDGGVKKIFGHYFVLWRTRYIKLEVLEMIYRKNIHTYC